jgi:pimeloyl-ACP methyl ester carboxylesterase
VPSVHVRGIDLHYETAGAGSPLVLVHGLGSSGRDWENLTPGLAGRHRVVLPDLRGHGRSGKPPGPYPILELARDLAALSDALGLGRSHFAGISLGGMAAFELALLSPEKVRSLTLVNTPPSTSLDSWRRRLLYANRLAVAALLGPRWTGRFLARHLFPETRQSSLRSTFVERWADNDRRAYIAALRGAAGWNAWSRADALSCPVLVVAAAGDYTPIDAHRRFVAVIPDAHLEVIAGSRHATAADAPEPLLAAIARFLDEVESRDLEVR